MAINLQWAHCYGWICLLWMEYHVIYLIAQENVGKKHNKHIHIRGNIYENPAQCRIQRIRITRQLDAITIITKNIDF